MTGDPFEPPQPWRTLLDLERPIPRLPSFTRARAVARAREAVVNPTPAASMSRAPGVPRWTLPVAIAGASLATLAVAHRLDRPAQESPVRLVLADEPGETMEQSGSKLSLPTVWEAPAAADHAPRRTVPSRDELVLLQSARAAVAASDFLTARDALLEHARRFPSGQLAEEREALRVKTLLGLGRAQDARQAARAFEARFPDSVLGPAVTRLTREPL